MVLFHGHCGHQILPPLILMYDIMYRWVYATEVNSVDELWQTA